MVSIGSATSLLLSASLSTDYCKTNRSVTRQLFLLRLNRGWPATGELSMGRTKN